MMAGKELLAAAPRPPPRSAEALSLPMRKEPFCLTNANEDGCNSYSFERRKNCCKWTSQDGMLAVGWFVFNLIKAATAAG